MNNLPSFLTIFFLILCLTLACESDPSVQPGNPQAFPDFSNCNCDTDSVNIVCNSEGQWFRNECFANCVGVSNITDSTSTCPDSIVNPLDTLTWPIQLVCHPILPAPPIVARLSDSTFIFEINDSTFIRGIPYDICRCLPGETAISTPNGHKRVANLKIGEKVFTKNLLGEIEIQPIVQINRVPVSDDHQLLYLLLEDGRELSLSPEHPAANGKALYLWEIGDKLEGSKIIAKEIKDFKGNYTWDLLPAGETGIYKADGIWIGSTLKQKTRVYTAPITD